MKTSTVKPAPPKWHLVLKAHRLFNEFKMPAKLANVLSGQNANPATWPSFASRGVDVLEWETALMYKKASENNIDALSILTISRNLVIENASYDIDTEMNLRAMMEIALQL